MRVLQVCAVDFTAFHFLHGLMRGLSDRGWSVEFACAPGRWVGALVEEGFRYRPVPMTRSLSPLAHVRAAVSLAASLRSDPPDVIHTHTPIGGLIGRAASFVVPRVPVAHTFHGLPLRSAARLGGIERAFLVLERVLALRTAFFFSQASVDLDHAIELGIARRRDSLVIGNGIDTERFAPNAEARRAVRLELRIPDDATVVISVGRLVREKGHLDALRAVGRISDGDVHLLIVGTALPSDRSNIEDELRREGAARMGPRFRLLGHRSDVERLLAASDIFVIASYREGLPRSVIEAMATGLSVIATDIPGHRELLEPDGVGVFVPVHDPDRMVPMLARLVVDHALREVIGARARAGAVARHREQDVVARQVPILKHLADH